MAWLAFSLGVLVGVTVMILIQWYMTEPCPPTPPDDGMAVTMEIVPGEPREQPTVTPKRSKT